VTCAKTTLWEVNETKSKGCKKKGGGVRHHTFKKTYHMQGALEVTRFATWGLRNNPACPGEQKPGKGNFSRTK